MTKSDLVNVVAAQADIAKKQALAAVNAMLDAIMDAVAQNKSVRLSGFGTFERRVLKARVRKLPNTQEEKMYPAKPVPKFRAGKTFKDTVLDA